MIAALRSRRSCARSHFKSDSWRGGYGVGNKYVNGAALSQIGLPKGAAWRHSSFLSEHMAPIDIYIYTPFRPGMKTRSTISRFCSSNCKTRGAEV